MLMEALVVGTDEDYIVLPKHDYHHPMTSDSHCSSGRAAYKVVGTLIVCFRRVVRLGNFWWRCSGASLQDATVQNLVGL